MAELKPRIRNRDDITQQIVIERREVVGVVEISPYGTKPIWESIFETMGKYVSENLDHRMMRLEFTLDDRKFVFGTEPEDVQNS